MRTAGLVAVALSLVSLHAHADSSKAWSAAKLGLPADAKIVIGLDFAALKKTQLFATYYPKLLARADAAETIDALKVACKIDPVRVVQSVVIATTEDQQDGAVYISLSGIDRAKLSSCMQPAFQRMADKTEKITVKHDGNVTQISDGKEARFLGWVGKDVIVVAVHAEDKASLAKWMGGKGALAKSTVGKTLARVNTSAALWGAGESTQEVQPGITVKGGYGTVAVSKGNLDADVHAVLASASQAATMASSAKQQLDDARQTPLLPASIDAVLKGVTIAAANDEVVVKASVVESDLLSVLALAGIAGP